jgi:bromodomain-containing protein 7/9
LRRRAFLELRTEASTTGRVCRFLRLGSNRITHLSSLTVEDPWSVLHTLAPELDVLPTVDTLFPPPTHVDSSQTPLPPPAHILPAAIPVPSVSSSQSSEPSNATPKRKYWSISRSGYGRGTRGKDREDTLEPTPGPGDRHGAERPLLATDYGGYGTLLGRLATEAKVTPAHAASALGTQERLHAFLRAGLDVEASPAAVSAPAPKGARGYWTDARARDAAEYLRDVVYGGPDGLAYIRSIAEFVSGPAATPCEDVLALPLGMTLPEWVMRTHVNPLTNGRLTLLASAAKRLLVPDDPDTAVPPHVQSQLDTSATLFPHLTLLLLAMRQILTQPIDLAHLLKCPEELLGVHVPAHTSEKRKRQEDGESSRDVKKPKREDGAEEVPDGDPLDMDVDIKSEPEDEEKPAFRRAPDFANAGEFVAALQASGDAIVALEQKRAKTGAKPTGAPVDDDMLEQLRLGLLRLARAVPVDQLAKLPPELVPPEIRHIVPTKG